MSCQILLNAVYATASRHLSNLGRFHPEDADKFHDNCMGELIPSLNDDVSAILDDNLFAATVVLRTKEEMDGICSFFFVFRLSHFGSAFLLHLVFIWVHGLLTQLNYVSPSYVAWL